MMRKPIWILAAVFAATPLFAQDDAPASPFSGGGGGAQVFTRVDAANPMEQVKTFLAKANVTLTSDQEKTLRPAVEAAIKQLQDISERFAAQRGGRAGFRGQGGQDGERRGGGERRGHGEGGRGGLAALANGPAAEELKKMNDDLMAKITAVLKPDQQAAFKKFQSDEIKKARPNRNRRFKLFTVKTRSSGFSCSVSPRAVRIQPNSPIWKKQQWEKSPGCLRRPSAKPCWSPARSNSNEFY